MGNRIEEKLKKNIYATTWEKDSGKIPPLLRNFAYFSAKRIITNDLSRTQSCLIIKKYANIVLQLLKNFMQKCRLFPRYKKQYDDDLLNEYVEYFRSLSWPSYTIKKGEKFYRARKGLNEKDLKKKGGCKIKFSIHKKGYRTSSRGA